MAEPGQTASPESLSSREGVGTGVPPSTKAGELWSSGGPQAATFPLSNWRSTASAPSPRQA